MLLESVIALITLLLIVVPWSLYTRTLGLLNDAPGTATLQRDGLAVVQKAMAVILEELLFSYNNSSWGLLGGGYGVLWVVCVGAIACGWRRFRNDAVLWFLALTVLGGMAFYVAVYTLRPFYSVERYLLHLAPIMVLVAARAVQPQPLHSQEETIELIIADTLELEPTLSVPVISARSITPPRAKPTQRQKRSNSARRR